MDSNVTFEKVWDSAKKIPKDFFKKHYENKELLRTFVIVIDPVS